MGWVGKKHSAFRFHPLRCEHAHQLKVEVPPFSPMAMPVFQRIGALPLRRALATLALCLEVVTCTESSVIGGERGIPHQAHITLAPALSSSSASVLAEPAAW